MKKRKMKKYLSEQNKEKKMKCSYHKSCGGIYFFGFVGAVIYYIQQAGGFWEGVLGVLKAIVWPAILVYKLLGFL